MHLITRMTLSALAIPALALGASAPTHASNTSQDVLTRLTEANLAATIKLSECSASLVRFANSTGTDKAMMLTNGHCYEGGMPGPDKVITNKASKQSGTLLNADGKKIGTVKADLVLYATMTDTDVTLYRLTQSFDEIEKSAKVKALTIAQKRPAENAQITIASGYWKRLWKCSINGFARNVKESIWSWHDSIRYSHPNCEVIGGSSGSPVLDNETLQVIGANNTKNEGRKACTMNSPCEQDDKGTIIPTKKGQSYGQQTYWLDTCHGDGSTIDLKKKGCKLHGGDAGPFPVGE